MSIVFREQDFETPEGRRKVSKFLNGIQEQVYDLTLANQEKLIEMGRVYAKPENLGQ